MYRSTPHLHTIQAAFYEQCKSLTVRVLNDCFAVFAVNVQDVFGTKAMLLRVWVQVGHSGAPFSVDIVSETYLDRKHNKYIKARLYWMFIQCLAQNERIL